MPKEAEIDSDDIFNALERISIGHSSAEVLGGFQGMRF